MWPGGRSRGGIRCPSTHDHREVRGEAVAQVHHPFLELDVEFFLWPTSAELVPEFVNFA